MSSNDPIVSHGRGGAANIGRDSQEYADGEIVREGVEGDQGDGAFSTGRGGAANIGSPGIRPKSGHGGDEEVIPETALRSGTPENYHTGRGGEGNAHHSGDTVTHHHDGLADKLKNKLFKKKEGEGKE